MKRALKIGLTGSIGSGKTTVASLFNALGVPTISADEIGKTLVAENQEVKNIILKHFGADILDEHNGLDRRKLRQIIFNHAEEKKWLESLLHPLIKTEISKQFLTLNTPYVVIEIPLLIETMSHEMVDRILIVHCDKASQLRRITSRDNISNTLAQKILQQQASLDEKLHYADDVLGNSGSLAELTDKVRKLHTVYLDLASKQ